MVVFAWYKNMVAEASCAVMCLQLGDVALIGCFVVRGVEVLVQRKTGLPAAYGVFNMKLSLSLEKVVVGCVIGGNLRQQAKRRE